MADVANVDQASAWDGDEGKRWAAEADRYDVALARYHDRLLTTAEIASSESVLDVGCGNGQTSLAAGRAAELGSVVGVDLSEAMLAVARERARAAGLTNAHFLRADAQVHQFEPNSFDVVISRFGAMFFGDPVAAFSNIARSMRPGARLALAVWQGLSENEWLTAIAAALAVDREPVAPPANAPGPLGLADPGHVQKVLGAAGFVDVALDDAREPFYAGADADDAFGFLSRLGFTRGRLEELEAPVRERALEELRRTIVEHDRGSAVLFDSAVWLVTARRP